MELPRQACSQMEFGNKESSHQHSVILACRRISSAAYLRAMPDEPRKIFDLMDTETEPTDEQLAELMHYVGEDIRAESARIRAREGSRSEADKAIEKTSDAPV